MSIRDQILNELRNQNRSQADLARALGTDGGTLRRILMNPGRVRFSRWQEIAEALKLKVVLIRAASPLKPDEA